MDTWLPAQAHTTLPVRAGLATLGGGPTLPFLGVSTIRTKLRKGPQLLLQPLS